MTRRLRLIRLWQSMGALLVLAVVYLSLTPAIEVGGPPGSDKLGHAAAYMLLAGFYGSVYRPRSFPSLALALIGLGGALEALQTGLPYRTADPLDLIANVVGVGAGLLLAVSPAGQTLEGAEKLLARIGQRGRAQ